jgi:hypothetical protein
LATVPDLQKALLLLHGKPEKVFRKSFGRLFLQLCFIQ